MANTKYMTNQNVFKQQHRKINKKNLLTKNKINRKTLIKWLLKTLNCSEQPWKKETNVTDWPLNLYDKCNNP